MKENISPENAVMGVTISLLFVTSSIGVKEALVSFGIGSSLSFFLSIPITAILIFGFALSLRDFNFKDG